MGDSPDGIDGIPLRTLLEHTNIGVVIHRADSSIIYANPTALRLLRLSYAQIIGKAALDPQWRFVDENERPLLAEEYPVSRVIAEKRAMSDEIIGVADSDAGDISWFMAHGYPELDEHGEISFIVITFNDITQLKTRFSFEDILHNTDDVVIVTESQNLDAPLGPKIVYVNRAFELLTGYSYAEVIGETPRILQGKDTDPATLQRIRDGLLTGEPFRECVLNYSKSGHPYWLDMHIVPLKNRLGQITHFAAIERDITEQRYQQDQLEEKNRRLRDIKKELQAIIEKRTEELNSSNRKLQRLAFFDALTDIPNRRSFSAQANQQWGRAKRSQGLLLTALIDIDHFKDVNDRHGHEMGDHALVAMARMLREFFRQEDVFGRWGGEEFACCLLVQQAEQGLEIMERLRHRLSECEVTTPDGSRVTISVSIGGALVRVLDDAEFALDAQLKRADAALYEAKAAGRNRVVVKGP